MTHKRFDEMVDTVLDWFQESSHESRLEFLHCEEQDLFGYHSGLGRQIRNHFKLWEAPWIPLIKGGIDESPNHPDQISMAIIKEVWNRSRYEYLI